MPLSLFSFAASCLAGGPASASFRLAVTQQLKGSPTTLAAWPVPVRATLADPDHQLEANRLSAAVAGAMEPVAAAFYWSFRPVYQPSQSVPIPDAKLDRCPRQRNKQQHAMKPGLVVVVVAVTTGRLMRVDGRLTRFAGLAISNREK